MSTEQIHALFYFLSFSPGPFWLFLIFVPQKKWPMILFDAYLLILSFIFAILTLPKIPELLPIIASPTFETIHSFLSTPVGTLGAWNHMILGDLWIGRWIIHDALKNKVSNFIRLPILGLVLFFGPLGLFCYLFYRILFLKSFRLT